MGNTARWHGDEPRYGATGAVKADDKPALRKGWQVGPNKENDTAGRCFPWRSVSGPHALRVCNLHGNDWLAAGKLNNDQVKAINSALETAMATFWPHCRKKSR